MKFLYLPFLIMILFCQDSLASDTVTVQTLTFDDISKRRGTWTFPSNTNDYRKIYMLYTLKCDPKTPHDNFNCGEWDYLTHTFVYIPTGVYDSTRKEVPQYSLGGSYSDTLKYATQQVSNIYKQTKRTIVDFTISNQKEAQFGDNNELFSLTDKKQRFQFFISKDEINNSGIDRKIAAMKLNFENSGYELNNFTIRLTGKPAFDTTGFINDNLTTVYSSDVTIDKSGNYEFPFDKVYSVNIFTGLVVDISYEINEVTPVFKAGNGYTHNVSGADNFLYFDGTNDFIDCGNVEYLNGAEEFTYELWLNIDEWENWNHIIGKGRKTSIELSNKNGFFNCNIDDDEHNFASAYHSVINNRWYHIAMTFNGKAQGNTERLKFYVNGEQKDLIYNGTIPSITDINNFPLELSSIRRNTSAIKGKMNEIRVWKKALSPEVISQWYNNQLDNSHPDFKELLIYYPVNQDNSFILNDESGNDNNGAFFGVPQVIESTPANLFVGANLIDKEPGVTLLNGDYTISYESSFYYDTLHVEPVSLIKWKIVDRTPLIDTFEHVSPGGVSSVYDENGNIISSETIEPDQTIINSKMAYYEVPYEIKDRIEIGRFITPYGINLDLGPDGFTWRYDVTDYAQYLTGDVELSAGNLQELIDMKFIFLEGTPPRTVKQIDRIWGSMASIQYKNLDNDSKLPPTNVPLHPDASQFKVVTRLTGHGHQSNDGSYPHCCEWIDNTHSLYVNTQKAAEWKIFNYDCAWNPVFPQGGTWPGAREGWCPGDIVRDFNYEITDYIDPQDNSVTLDYAINPVPADNQGMGNGNYVVAMHLVQYGDHNFDNDVEIYDVITPNRWEYYSRINPICSFPKILVRNNGKTKVQSLELSYYVSGQPATVEVIEASLEPNETRELTLTNMSGDFWMGDGTNQFFVELSAVDGQKDDNPENDIYMTHFDMPDQYSETPVLHLKTNARAAVFSYKVYNSFNEVVLEKTNMQANTLYTDTLNLPSGCYKVELLDPQQAGLSYWAYTQQGEGYFRIYDTEGKILKNFNPDFGAGVIYSFSIGNETFVQDRQLWDMLSLYPNPATNELTLQMDYAMGNSLIEIFDISGKKVFEERVIIDGNIFKILDISHYPSGAYTIKVTSKANTVEGRFIKK